MFALICHGKKKGWWWFHEEIFVFLYFVRREQKFEKERR